MINFCSILKSCCLFPFSLVQLFSYLFFKNYTIATIHETQDCGGFISSSDGCENEECDEDAVSDDFELVGDTFGEGPTDREADAREMVRRGSASPQQP